MLIDRVAAVVPIREHRRDGGVVELDDRPGAELVDTRAQRIEFTPSPVITPAMRYDGGAGALSGLTLNGADITPGGPGSQAIAGGALAGQFAVRDRLAPALSDRADALAGRARRTASPAAPRLDPTVAPGEPGLFTDDGNPIDPLNCPPVWPAVFASTRLPTSAGGDAARLRDGSAPQAPALPPTAPAAAPCSMP